MLAALRRDLAAVKERDPAARGDVEIVLCYPGLHAVWGHRLSHWLWTSGRGVAGRLVAAGTRTLTGVDIHPGATIGAGLFIDHATGVVIGETTEIGAHVKLYQGVTLGALSFPRDSDGQIIRGRKRHPTVEDGVTLYANATVLGGGTVVGADSVIGGSVFLAHSVPPRSRVSLKEPELRVAVRDPVLPADAAFFEI